MKNALGRVINGTWMPPANLAEPPRAALQTCEGSVISSMAIKAACFLKEAAEISTAHKMPEVNDYDGVYFLQIWYQIMK